MLWTERAIKKLRQFRRKKFHKTLRLISQKKTTPKKKLFRFIISRIISWNLIQNYFSALRTSPLRVANKKKCEQQLNKSQMFQVDWHHTSEVKTSEWPTYRHISSCKTITSVWNQICSWIFWKRLIFQRKKILFKKFSIESRLNIGQHQKWQRNHAASSSCQLCV